MENSLLYLLILNSANFFLLRRQFFRTVDSLLGRFSHRKFPPRAPQLRANINQLDTHWLSLIFLFLFILINGRAPVGAAPLYVGYPAQGAALEEKKKRKKRKTTIDQLFPALEMYFCRASFNPRALSASFPFAAVVFVRSPPLGGLRLSHRCSIYKSDGRTCESIQIRALAFVIPEPPRISVMPARSPFNPRRTRSSTRGGRIIPSEFLGLDCYPLNSIHFA